MPDTDDSWFKSGIDFYPEPALDLFYLYEYLLYSSGRYQTWICRIEIDSFAVRQCHLTCYSAVHLT